MKALKPAEVQKLAEDDSVFVIDCRSAADYIAGHIPYSVFVPMEMTFAIWAAFVVDPRKGDKIVLVVAPGREEEAITRLSRTGIDCVVGFLEGGFDSWKSAGLEVKATKVLEYGSAEEFKERTADYKIVDVRNLGEWEGAVLETAHL